MNFENNWLMVATAIVAGVTLIAVIAFVMVSNEGSSRQGPIAVPTMTGDDEDAPSPVEENVTKVIYLLSPVNPNRLVPAERVVFNLIPQSRVAGQVLQQLLQGPGETDPGYAPIPRGTRLRSVFFSEKGLAIVVLSEEAYANHSGGTAAELMSVYSIVTTLCVNFPSIQAVQIVVENAPDSTFAGHIDISWPLTLEDDYFAFLQVQQPKESEEDQEPQPLNGEETSEQLQ